MCSVAGPPGLVRPLPPQHPHHTPDSTLSSSVPPVKLGARRYDDSRKMFTGQRRAGDPEGCLWPMFTGEVFTGHGSGRSAAGRYFPGQHPRSGARLTVFAEDRPCIGADRRSTTHRFRMEPREARRVPRFAEDRGRTTPDAAAVRRAGAPETCTRSGRSCTAPLQGREAGPQARAVKSTRPDRIHGRSRSPRGWSPAAHDRNAPDSRGHGRVGSSKLMPTALLPGPHGLCQFRGRLRGR